MQHSEYELATFPRLCAFSDTLSDLSLEQMIDTFENDAVFIQEIRQVYFRTHEMPAEERALKDIFSKKMVARLGNRCAELPELFHHLVFSQSQSEAMYPLSNMISGAKSVIRSKIFRHYGNLELSMQNRWRTSFWPDNAPSHEGWRSALLRKDYCDKKGQERKRDRNIAILCEVEGTAALVIDYICSTYTPRSGGFMGGLHSRGRPFKPEKGVKLSSLVEVVKKWPKLAYKIINAMFKCQDNLKFYEDLLPCLLSQVKENHPASLQTLMNIRFLEALFVEGSDFNEVLELWAQYKVYGDSYICFKQLKYFADVLSGQEIPDKFFDFCLMGVSRDRPVVTRIELAYEFYQRILQGTTDRTLVAEVRVQLNDSRFRFEMAEYYHRDFQFEKAQAFYEDLLKDGQVTVDAAHLFILKSPIGQDVKQQKLTELGATEVKVLDNGREALLRLALLWTDRLNSLNLNPTRDPMLAFDSVLAFQMAERFICSEKYAEAFRLLSLIPDSSELFKASQSKLTLLKPYGKKSEVAEPYLSRMNIIEFVLPHFQKAMDAGHPEAERTVMELLEELESLRESKPSGYKPGFVVEIGMRVINNQTELEEYQVHPLKTRSKTQAW